MLNQPIPSFFSSIKQSFQFHSRLKLSNVSYRYNSESPLVLKDINLDINFGERIRIVGTTGSGKHLIDLIMGTCAYFWKFIYRSKDYTIPLIQIICLLDVVYFTCSSKYIFN